MRLAFKVIFLTTFFFPTLSNMAHSDQGKYPWSVNLDLDHSKIDGYKADLKLQQGVSFDTNWREVKFVPFVEAELIQSSNREDYWFNVFEPAIGLKFRYQSPGKEKGKVQWKEMDFGVRHTKYEYTGDRISQDQEEDRTEIFMNLYMSGHW